MGNTFGAHIFKRRQVGEREEVRIKLFKPDGTPLDLDAPPVDPDPGGGSAPVGTMVFKGVWGPANDYDPYDVVLYNPGDGQHTYIVSQAIVAGAPVMNDPAGHPITKFWDPLTNSMELVIDAQSNVGDWVHSPGSPYDCFAIKINAPGLLQLPSAPVDAVSRDMYGTLFHQKPDGSWEYASGNDDSAGNGHPYIATQVVAGVYAYGLAGFGGGVSPAYYEHALVTMGGGDAVIGSFADFPTPKVTRIG